MKKRFLAVALFFFDIDELYLTTTDITHLGKGIENFLNELIIHLGLGELKDVLNDEGYSELKDTLVEIDSMVENNCRVDVILNKLFYAIPSMLVECSVKYKVVDNE